MLTAEEKIQHFSRQVFTKAQAQCNDLLHEAEQEVKAQLEAYENKCLEKTYGQIQKQISQIQKEAGEAVSQLRLESKKELLGKREGMMKQIFDEVLAKIAVFHSSEEYPAYLEQVICSSAELLGEGEKTVFLDASDASLSASLAEKFPKLHFSVLSEKEPVFGGARVLNHDTHQLADNTIAARLEEEKQHFFETSGLTL